MSEQKPAFPPQEVARYDLTSKLSQFMDRHLMFPIFQFLQDINIYEVKDIMRAKIDLLKETNMVDFALDMYSEIGDEVPSELLEKRTTVLEELERSQADVQDLLVLLDDDETTKEIAACKSVQAMCEQFELHPDILEYLFDYAKMQFQCGNYSVVAEILKHYRSISLHDSERMNQTKQFFAIWGSLACFILNAEMEMAADHAIKLDEYFETVTMKMSKQEALLQRVWLIHWMLFILFKTETENVKLLELFLGEKNLQVICVACPHVLRYVAVLVILNKRYHERINLDIVQRCKNESGSYKDPVTQFLMALYLELDFDEAQLMLKECMKLMYGDYFLNHLATEFEENARTLLFETYCRIHQYVNISMIAEKLNMRSEEAERWIVKLIQSAKLDARIDSEKNRVVMAKQNPSVYSQVIEKTKNISYLSVMIQQNLDKPLDG